MMDLLKFTSLIKKKKMKWSCNLNIQLRLPKFNYIGPKKILRGHKFFFKVKNHKVLKFIYKFFFSQDPIMTTLASTWSGPWFS